MTRKIFKYPLNTTDWQSVDMPKGAKILTVQVQNDVPCIWAIVDTAQETESRRFRIAGTGHPIDDLPLDYIGTFQLLDGKFVGHLFELVNRK